MKKLKEDLLEVNKKLEALTKKTESLIGTIEKIEKKKKSSLKVAKRVPVRKKTAMVTDTEKVLRIIRRSKKGASVAALRKKTGFNSKKISNIVHRAAKNMILKSIGRGVYAQNGGGGGH